MSDVLNALHSTPEAKDMLVTRAKEQIEYWTKVLSDLGEQQTPQTAPPTNAKPAKVRRSQKQELSHGDAIMKALKLKKFTDGATSGQIMEDLERQEHEIGEAVFHNTLQMLKKQDKIIGKKQKQGRGHLYFLAE